MDGVSLALTVVQTYRAVLSAYNLYVNIKDFPSTYLDLHFSFRIEKFRLTQWGEHMLSEVEQKRLEQSEQDIGLWQLFQVVVDKMWKIFQENSELLDDYGKLAGVSGEQEPPDSNMLQSLSLSTKSQPKSSIGGFAKKMRFVLRDRKKLEQLIKSLCYWNDSLEKMSSRLLQDSFRRRLRTKFSTGNMEQLQQLEAAAVLLKHRDLQGLASARAVVEQGYLSEKLGHPVEEKSTSAPPESNYQLEMSQLDFHGSPFLTDQIRAMATWQGQSVVVDWRLCRDDTWRRENPKAFRLRTQNLTKILNKDLAPLGLSVLHCIGYLDQSSKVTGYAFRLPPEAPQDQKPLTLHQLFATVRQPSDVPGLGERFELAKALVSTVFEIHNLGWLHKNLSPKQVVFFKRGNNPEPDLSRPFLMGFDISRPNAPGEVSEKPLSDSEDDLYRHPDYRSVNSQSFLPSFDIFSLGILLFEIGLWRSVGAQGQRRSSNRQERPDLQSHTSDPQFIEKVVTRGQISDLKRYMGKIYHDAVFACLSKDLDRIWKNDESDQELRLQRHQSEVQTKVVDAIASCRA
ncbi:MAG: hypothetical protein LQ342_002670 [Letrouitia transgressa]|nr:MAG: hypothetical protein LQ342_002670 [Letrouitia transgressa]